MAITPDLSGNTPTDTHSASKSVDVTAPRGSFPVTPSDSLNLQQETRQVYAAGAGTISYRNAQGAGPFSITLAAGEVVPLNCRQILATGTTCTGIEGRY